MSFSHWERCVPHIMAREGAGRAGTDARVNRQRDSDVLLGFRQLKRPRMRCQPRSASGPSSAFLVALRRLYHSMAMGSTDSATMPMTIGSSSFWMISKRPSQ